ncbi:MAG: 23S rRNA (pseudouridine(1915)-N(3))-methyltransferase RlmH [Bacillota bacterium]
MRIRILIAGKVRERYLQEGAGEYLKRLRPYARVEMVELQDEPLPEGASPGELARVREREGERLLRALKEDEYLVALDIRGRQFSSEEFSLWLQERALRGESSLAFAIGGTTGLAPAVLERARLRLSLGLMTFPHQMVPLLLLEQIYRGFKIAAGEPYHR